MAEGELADLARVRRELSNENDNDPQRLAEYCRRREEQLQRESVFPRFAANEGDGGSNAVADSAQPTSPSSSTRP